jgi:hypothetical protein
MCHFRRRLSIPSSLSKQLSVIRGYQKAPPPSLAHIRIRLRCAERPAEITVRAFSPRGAFPGSDQRKEAWGLAIKNPLKSSMDCIVVGEAAEGGRAHGGPVGE